MGSVVIMIEEDVMVSAIVTRRKIIVGCVVAMTLRAAVCTGTATATVSARMSTSHAYAAAAGRATCANTCKICVVIPIAVKGNVT
jgi:hypothetical protein